jgi:hypothetical protein
MVYERREAPRIKSRSFFPIKHFEASVMRLPRVRYTVRQVMAVVAVVGITLGWSADRVERVRRLVTFEYNRLIENEPLDNPTNAVAVDSTTLALEDGRVIRIGTGPLCDGCAVLKDVPGPEACVVDLQTHPDGSATVHMLKPGWSCGNCSYRSPICIPLFPRTVYRNYRTLIGYGKVIEATSVMPKL